MVYTASSSLASPYYRQWIQYFLFQVTEVKSYSSNWVANWLQFNSPSSQLPWTLCGPWLFSACLEKTCSFYLCIYLLAQLVMGNKTAVSLGLSAVKESKLGFFFWKGVKVSALACRQMGVWVPWTPLLLPLSDSAIIGIALHLEICFQNVEATAIFSRFWTDQLNCGNKYHNNWTQFIAVR